MKNLLFISFLFLSVTFSSCDTDLPDTDDTPPQFTFVIKGDGLNRSFNQNQDFTRFQVNLRTGVTYEFTLICTDDGALAKTTWEFVPDYYEFGEPLESPWTMIDITPLNRQFLWLGDRNNPLTGTTLQGTFKVSGHNIVNVLRFRAKDFGSSSGSPNTFFAELQIYIGDHQTEIIYY